jgi:hypothetical protein
MFGQQEVKHMKTRDLTTASLLLAMGMVLHAVTPAILGGVKPDFLLAMMFIAILIRPIPSHTFVVSIAAGIIAALTTSFPGGQLPSVIDKLGSGFFVLLMEVLLIKQNRKFLPLAVLGFVATMVSGILFLGSAALIVGLPAPMGALMAGVVFPTAVANSLVCGVVSQVLKSTRVLRTQTAS